MIWSFFVGAVALLGIRMTQVTGSSGHPGAFPKDLVLFYLVVEVLLALILICILGNRSWAVPALLVLLVAILLWTIFFLKGPGWAPDFLPNALVLEAVWLGPWIFVAWFCRSRTL